MKMFPNAFDLMRASSDFTRMAFEAQSVIFLRTMGFAGLWRMSHNEFSRMVWEKPEAFSLATTAAFTKLANGGRSDEIVRAAIRPLKSKAGANRKRLSRRRR